MNLDRAGPLAHHSLGALLILAATTACNDGGEGSGDTSAEPLLVDFALRTDLHLGSAFVGDLLHVDLDEDGVEDLVEGNFGTRRLTLARGHLDGSFTTLFELPTLGHAFRLASGDVDGDGLLDVAVASGDWMDGAPQAVQVFLQGPLPFEFGAAIALELDTDPKDLCIAPLSGVKGDSGPGELFVALRDVQRVQRLVLAGGALVDNGTLDSAGLGLGRPYSVAALDVGGDGLLDVVVGEDNPGLDRVLEYARTASGFLPPTELLNAVSKPIVDATGDMDGNGFEDLAVAQFEGTEVVLLAGDAAGLTRAFALDFGGVTTSLLFEDLDGDGLAEVMATLFLQESLQVRRGLAPFTWDEPVHYNVGIGPRALGALLLPGDDHKDLVCANAQDLSLLRGYGDGRFRCATGAATGERPVVVDTADLDGDGDQDAVAVARDQAALLFLENRGGRLESVLTLPLAPTAKNDAAGLAFLDADLDGDVDVLVTVSELGELRLYRNQGGPESFGEPLAADVYALGGEPLGLASGDLDGDGRPDAIVGRYADASVQVLLGRGDGTFAPDPPLALDFAPLELLCADFDGDGHTDVAASARMEVGQALALFGGDGDGGLRLNSTFPLASTAGGLAAGDLDENGRTDLVIGQFPTLTSELAVLMNRGALDFDARTFELSPGPGTPLIEDVDRDGHLDLLVLSIDGEILLARGDGHGAFVDEPRERGEMPCPDGTVSAALADVDGDSLPDILMVSPESPFVWVAENVSQELPEN